MKKLNHPAFPKLHQYWHDELFHYIETDFVEGGELLTLIDSYGLPSLDYVKLFGLELLDALEPNLVAFAGGVSVVSAKDAVTALNNIKRLQYQARWPVQQVRTAAACLCACCWHACRCLLAVGFADAARGPMAHG